MLLEFADRNISQAKKEIAHGKDKMYLDAFQDSIYWCTFEGIDGTGKTTIINHVVPILQEKILDKIPILITPEFSYSPIGDLIRHLVEKNRFVTLNTDYPTTMAMTLLLASDQFLKLESLSSLNNKIIISDRGVDSRMAYQTIILLKDYPQLSQSDALAWLKKIFSLLPFPNRTFLLRAPIEVISKRANNRLKTNLEPPLKEEDLKFLADVDELFVQIAKSDRERFVFLDAEKDIDKLKFQVVDIILSDISKINERTIYSQD